MEIKFEVPGNPKALKRHRTVNIKTKTGKSFVTQYDPSKGTKNDFLALAAANRPDEPFDCPLIVEMIFNFDRPKSHFRTGKFSNELKDNAPIYHTSAPDCDNLAKFVCDALNGIFWKDDRVISKLVVSKFYTSTPKTQITIRAL